MKWSARYVEEPETHRIIQVPFCSTTDTCYSNASERISRTESIWNKFCSSCTQSCESVDYTVTASSVAAPSLPFAWQTKQFVESLNITLPTDWSQNWLTEVKNNYVSLDIQCESTEVDIFQQDSSISGVDVLSNVGGHTGLWIGISLLSLMELVEMMYRLIRYEFFTLQRKIRQLRNDHQIPTSF